MKNYMSSAVILSIICRNMSYEKQNYQVHTVNGRQESQDNTVLEEPLEVSSKDYLIRSDEINLY